MDGTAAHAEAAGLPYRVVRFADTGAGSREVLLLEERTPTTKGWGTFVFDPAPLRDLVVEASHARYDVDTESQALTLFRRLRARAYVLAGTHRCASAERTPCDGTTDVCGTTHYRVSDPAHFTDGPFQAAHEALAALWPASLSFSVHGHSSSSCEDVFLSSGVGADPGPLVPALRERLFAEGGLTVGAAGIPGSSCSLTGGTNVQGRFSNGSSTPCTKAATAASGRFLHAEQSREVRTDAALTEKLARALEAVLPAPGPATRLVLPSSARSPGAGGTFFTTELTLSNPGALAAKIEVRFAAHDEDGTGGPARSVLLAAGASGRWSDVLGTLFSIGQGWGALHVTSASAGIVAAGQTTTPAAGGGTYGQSVPAFGPAEWVGHGAPRSIPGIREDAAFRTNLVVANPGVSEVVVSLELTAEDGSPIGAGTVTLPPLGMTQLSRVARVLGATGYVRAGPPGVERAMRAFRRTAIPLLLLAAAAEVAMATEEPRHRVLETRDGWELRLYEPMVVAETVVSGDFGPGGNEGFRRLAGYIFGGNDGGRKLPMTSPVTRERRGGTKIAMTAPVAQERTHDGWTIAFVMPAGYTMATLPGPDDPRVTLREVPARPVAAVSFSGTWGAERFDAVARDLLAKIDAAGLAPAGPPVYARYDPPWTPWFLRRNEVLVPLADAPAGR